jgi:putative transposase
VQAPKADKALTVRIEAAHEKDDTMGHRTLAALLGTGKNHIRRVLHKYGIAARRKRKKYDYPGKATEIVPNQLREEAFEWMRNEVVFSDILEIKLTDGTRVRGCFCASSPSAPDPLDRVRLSYACRSGYRRH